MKSKFMSGICLTTVFCLTVVAGCTKSNQERIIGKWEGKIIVDEDAFKASDAMKQLPEAARELAVSGFKNELEKKSFKIEFLENGTVFGKLNAAGDENDTNKKEAQWTIVKQEGDKITIKTTDKKDKEEEIVIVFQGNDTFTIVPPENNKAPEGVQLRFARK